MTEVTNLNVQNVIDEILNKLNVQTHDHVELRNTIEAVVKLQKRKNDEFELATQLKTQQKETTTISMPSTPKKSKISKNGEQTANGSHPTSALF